MSARKICVVLTTRGNYGKMKSTMRAIAGDPALDLVVVIGGALALASYGDFDTILAADGFSISARMDYIVGADSVAHMTSSAARCTEMFGALLQKMQPDLAVIVADRYEALALALAALCMNVRIAHLEGGEVSGSIDERIRHAVTKLSHWHFPANEDAAQRIIRMGEAESSVFVVGTPSLDLVAGVDISDKTALKRILAERGIGPVVDVDRPYIVVSQHPVVTEFDAAAGQFAETSAAVRALGMPAVWVLPNLDAGAAAVLAPLQALQAEPSAPPVRSVGSLPLEAYVTLLRHASCLVGNTSSGIREGAFLGVPVVNIGTRQSGRGRSQNVVDVPADAQAIAAAARAQMDHGPYPSDTLYGDGLAGEKIARVLAGPLPPLDKGITY